MPSRYEAWEDGERTKGISIENVIGGPAYRSSHSDHLLQMADLIAHALLKQAEEPSPRVDRLGVDRAFGILDRTLNRRASKRDRQGVVRKSTGGRSAAVAAPGHTMAAYVSTVLNSPRHCTMHCVGPKPRGCPSRKTHRILK